MYNVIFGFFIFSSVFGTTGAFSKARSQYRAQGYQDWDSSCHLRTVDGFNPWFPIICITAGWSPLLLAGDALGLATLLPPGVITHSAPPLPSDGHRRPGRNTGKYPYQTIKQLIESSPDLYIVFATSNTNLIPL